eukprot:6459318-Amphidinium_carterae.1
MVKADRDLYGGVRALSRNTVVHGVLIGDVAFPLDIWVTLCGWHFGYSRHLRTSGEKVTCRRCLGLVGGRALGGEVSGGSALVGASGAVGVEGGERFAATPSTPIRCKRRAAND